jgi:hypothetical protein
MHKVSSNACKIKVNGTKISKGVTGYINVK